MELAFVVYLISILENVRSFLLFICFATIGTSAMLAFYNGVEDNPQPKKWHVFLIITFLMAASFRTILPTEQQGYTIAAAYATQKIAENEKVQDIGGKVLTILNQKLDQAIKETK